MNIYPKDCKEKLEFDKIIAFIQEECLSLPARDYFATITTSDDISIIQTLLDEVDEYKKSIERGDHIPIARFESIIEDLPLLRKEGYVLEIESIQKIYHIVHIGSELIQYFNDPIRSKFHPLISTIVKNIIIDSALNKEIDRVLDEEGNIRPNASDELLRISKQIKSKERELDNIFNTQLEHYRKLGLLVDTNESIRMGRRVLTVAVEHRRKIPGIIHDESATGKTIYVEPELVVFLNQEIYNLYSARRHEIYKILRALCAFIRPYADALLVVEHILTKVDTIRAKAKFAHKINAKKPFLQSEPIFALKTAYNPVLLLKNELLGIPVIPFDLVLHGQNRILVLSGPNAGGKSVAMKSIGLLQLMIQSGMLVTADENSTFGLYSKIIVDIGDQQSLEDDLSTYSSHLFNMKYTTEVADDKTLFLIDEFGSGTDPKIGGAIAEAILYRMNGKKSFGCITTHYSNLKYFAYKTKGLLNGSMEFDTETLSPTFRMQIGKPGSSFAFEIAAKIGLDNKIVEYAKNKTGKNEKAIDELLINLMSEKKEYEDKFISLIEKQDRLDKLILSYEQMNEDLDIRRKKIKLVAKEQSAISVMNQSQQMEKVLKDIRNAKDEDRALQAAINLKKQKEDALLELEKLKNEVFAKEISASTKPLKVGSHVKMRNGTQSGEILSIQKNMAEVQMGFITLKVPLVDLVSAKEDIVIRSKKSIQTDVSSHYDRVDTKIDIREYTKSDALRLLQDFMDRAIMGNAHEVKIIHGVGTGVMRNEVKKLLRQYKDVKETWHPEPEQGGDGVTFAKL